VFIFRHSSLSAVVLVVVMVSDMVLPCYCHHCWCVCRVGCGQSMTVVGGSGHR